VSESLGKQAAQAADNLYAALHPGDETRGPRTDIPPELVTALQQAIAAFGRAEDALAPGIGQPDLQGGNAALREARDVLEPVEIGAPFIDQSLRSVIHAALDVARRQA
jgi:hypothetical protein